MSTNILKSLMVAVAENGVIGNKGQIPWHLPNDLKRFKKRTYGKAIIMGRGTFLSIGKILPGRYNIILSRNQAYHVPGGIVVHGLVEAFAHAAAQGIDEVYIIGGEKVYQAALPYIDVVYLTRVHAQPAGDTFFHFNIGHTWQEVDRKHHPADAKHAYAYSFITYRKKR